MRMMLRRLSRGLLTTTGEQLVGWMPRMRRNRAGRTPDLLGLFVGRPRTPRLKDQQWLMEKGGADDN